MPNNLEYVTGTTYLYNSSNKNGKKLGDTVATDGVNIGNLSAGGSAYVTFTTKVVNKTLVCGSNRLINWANSSVNSKALKDDASVMVTRTEDCGSEPVTPPVMPETGMTEIALGAVGVGLTVTAAGYYVASRKKLMK